MSHADRSWYFAYGSNMDLESLRRRGIEVHDSARAQLRGYRLVFDLHVNLFRQEPRMANLRRAPGHTVHGVAHLLSADDLARLDAFEFTYDRIAVELAFYDGRTAVGGAYIATDPAFLAPEDKPSERYLCILRSGARAHDLAPEFCDWLDAQPAHVMPPDPGLPAALATLEGPRISLDEVVGEGSQLAAFGGFVFDFGGVHDPFADTYLIRRDATAFLLGRMLDLPQPVKVADLHPRQWAWMHHALHDLVGAARVAGVLDGGLEASLKAEWR